MSEQRLDLKSRCIGCFAYMDVWNEALRAQASEDALRERVRVLEETVARLRGHIDHEMLRVLDANGLGGGKGEG